jgi:hypothetical protein
MTTVDAVTMVLARVAMNQTSCLYGTIVVMLGALAIGGCASPGTRTNENGVAEVPVIDTRATDALKRMTDFLGQQPRMQFDMTVFYDDYEVGDLKVQYARHVEVKVERPNHAAGVSEGDTGRRRFWYDGARVTSADETAKTYSQLDVPSTFDGMVDTMMNEYDTPLPVADFLTAGAYDRLMDGVTNALFVGEHLVGKDKCEHLVFEGDDRDWQVWIAPGDQPVLRKLVIAYKTMPNCPEYIAVFQRWDCAPKFSADDFKPVIPNDAIQVQRPAARMHAPAPKS